MVSLIFLNLSHAKSSYFLSTSLINIYLQLHSPISKDYPPFFKVQLNSTDVTTQEVNQRVIVHSDISMIFSQQVTVKGKIEVSASLAYNAPLNQVYITQPKIESLEFEHLNTSTDVFLSKINPLLSHQLDRLVIYEFTKENAMLPKAPSQIKVEDGGIRFIFD
jgi:hypothetical protein